MPLLMFESEGDGADLGGSLWLMNGFAGGVTFAVGGVRTGGAREESSISFREFVASGILPWHSIGEGASD